MIIWTEDDDNSIKALQYLKDNGKSLTIPESGKFCIEFEVIDHLKANNFIMDLAQYSNEEEKLHIEDITGIRINGVNPSTSVDKSQIRELLIQAIEKLS